MFLELSPQTDLCPDGESIERFKCFVFSSSLGIHGKQIQGLNKDAVIDNCL